MHAESESSSRYVPIDKRIPAKRPGRRPIAQSNGTTGDFAFPSAAFQGGVDPEMGRTCTSAVATTRGPTMIVTVVPEADPPYALVEGIRSSRALSTFIRAVMGWY